MPFFGFGRKKKKDDDDFVATKRGEGKFSQEDKEIMSNASAIQRTASQREVRQVERNVEVLVKGVAKDIRNLCMEATMSKAWQSFVPVIRRVANAIDVESTLTEKDKDSTLWNTTKERVLKGIVTSKKVTTMINLARDMKKYEYETFSEKWVGPGDLPEDFKDQLRDFEVSIGQIIRHLVNRKESLQATNVLQVVEHCDFVLQNAYLNMHSEILSDPLKIATCKILSFMFDTDEYLAKRNKYVPDDMKREVLALEDTTLSYLIGKDRSLRRKLRPLLSQIKLFGIPAKPKSEAHEMLKAHIKSLEGLKGQELCNAFAKSASEHSDCGSYRKGGDLGYFTRGQMQKPFENASFALKIGYMTGIVDTDSGSHIIMRIG
eukprot:g583.t1